MPTESIEGQFVSLRPATNADRRPIFEWMACSDLTHLMMGPPLFPEVEPPDWEEFQEDYVPHYFSDELPEMGRCFVIEVDGEAMGQINYNPILVAEKQVEMDIWLREMAVMGKGYGTAAIRMLVEWLAEEMGCRRFILAPSARNPGSIRAYEKAGFVRTEEKLKGFEPDYYDTVVMVKELEG